MYQKGCGGKFQDTTPYFLIEMLTQHSTSECGIYKQQEYMKYKVENVNFVSVSCCHTKKKGVTNNPKTQWLLLRHLNIYVQK